MNSLKNLGRKEIVGESGDFFDKIFDTTATNIACQLVKQLSERDASTLKSEGFGKIDTQHIMKDEFG
ncbi:hypothetical protein T01_1789 [Trichinella spiralis]|uniref:Uncharacterized protein n=1 Tax=Trichinella spiralis TaxID=6334 RepID=A0A0V1BZJ7_TRISP|nr:hypothetical protein T01_1789 [Trichinella spiralis]